MAISVPRIVHSVEELDALLPGSVVMDAGDGGVYVKERRVQSANQWLDLTSSAGAEHRFVEDSNTILWQSSEPSATVLWEPPLDSGRRGEAGR